MRKNPVFKSILAFLLFLNLFSFANGHYKVHVNQETSYKVPSIQYYEQSGEDISYFVYRCKKTDLICADYIATYLKDEIKTVLVKQNRYIPFFDSYNYRKKYEMRFYYFMLRYRHSRFVKRKGDYYLIDAKLFYKAFLNQFRKEMILENAFEQNILKEFELLDQKRGLKK